jgi:peptidyl-prolyl cis-trans isomerase C
VSAGGGWPWRLAGTLVLLVLFAHISLAALSFLADVGSHARGATDDAIRLAQVGPLALDAATFRRRAALVAEQDLTALGPSWPERRRRFLDEVLIPELLLTLAGEREGSTLPPARDVALARTLAAASARTAADAAASDADVLAWYTREREQLGAPRALSLWRILLPTEAAARAVIAELAPPTAAVFGRLARERSLDRATLMRSGNLGQVAVDGQTRVPELRVSPALFAAADRVQDGELVPEPVLEGEQFAVVWRRASHAPTVPSLAEATPRIRARLAEERAAAALDSLLDALRRKHLVDYHPERARAYEPRFPEASTPSQRPRAAPGSERPQLLPEMTDRGLR